MVTGAGAGVALFGLSLRMDGMFSAPDVPLWRALVPGAGVGAFLGGFAAVAGLVLRTLQEPADRPLVLTPERSLRQDRAAALVRSTSLWALTSALLLTAVFSLQDGANIPGLSGQPWLAVGPTALALSAWGRFLTVRVWCAVTGQLPWRLMAFLKDAHVRGVLRQVGAVYQFRHVRLQERLTLPAPDRREPGHPPVPRPRSEPTGQLRPPD